MIGRHHSFSDFLHLDAKLLIIRYPPYLELCFSRTQPTFSDHPTYVRVMDLMHGLISSPVRFHCLFPCHTLSSLLVM